MTADTNLNQIIIGALLKAHRESNDLTQRDVAGVLGYKGYNFISMVESGKVKIPIERILDWGNAYRVNYKELACVVYKLYPELWETFSVLFNKVEDNSKSSIEDNLKQTMKKHGLSKLLS